MYKNNFPLRARVRITYLENKDTLHLIGATGQLVPPFGTNVGRGGAVVGLRLDSQWESKAGAWFMNLCEKDRFELLEEL